MALLPRSSCLMWSVFLSSHIYLCNNAMASNTKPKLPLNQREKATMVGSKRLSELAKKWKKMAVSGRKRIFVASRGHVFLYTIDGWRFMIPLPYLNNELFRELFRMAEEVFGLPTDGPIKVPCDAAFMENLLSLLRYSSSMDMERAAALKISNFHCRASALPMDLQKLQVAVL